MVAQHLCQSETHTVKLKGRFLNKKMAFILSYSVQGLYNSKFLPMTLELSTGISFHCVCSKK